MPARKAPPVAAVVVGVLVAAAIVFVVLNRAANRPPEADAQAVPTPKGAVVRALDR